MIQVTITDPVGAEMDVSSRLEESDLDSLVLAMDDELNQLVRGDMGLTLSDPDGAVEDFLNKLAPGTIYEIKILRLTEGRRSTWNLAFAGVIDLPWSMYIDRKSETIKLQAFTWAKALDNISAETVQPTFQAMTASVTASSQSVTVDPDTTDLRVSDKITLTDDTNTETRTIVAITSGTVVSTSEPWDDTFTDAELTVETPYHRRVTVAWLVEQLYTTAGITDQSIKLTSFSGDIPFLSPGNAAGLPPSTNRQSLTIESDLISCVTDGDTYATADPVSEWSNVDPDGDPQGDWTPYLDTEPSAILRNTYTGGQHVMAFDYVNDDLWSLEQVITGTLPNFTTTLYLTRNETRINTVASYGPVAAAGYSSSIEYDPVNDEIWASYRQNNQAAGSGVTRIWDVSATGWSSYQSYNGFIRYLGRQARMVLERDAATDTGRIMELHTTGSGKAYEKDFHIPEAGEAYRQGTLREFDNYIGCVYSSGQLFVKLWDAVTLSVFADIAIEGTGTIYVTRHTDTSSGIESLILVSLDTYQVISRSFFGLVSYANFEGMSVATALKELAILTMSFVDVDNLKTGIFHTRTYLDESIQPVELGGALDLEEAPVWDLYRGSIKVQGKTEGDEDFESLVGQTTDSNRRLSVEGALITDPVVGSAIGSAYYAFLGVLRRQVTGTWQYKGEILRPLQAAIYDGRTYIVLEAELDIEDEEIDLILATQE